MRHNVSIDYECQDNFVPFHLIVKDTELSTIILARKLLKGFFNVLFPLFVQGELNEGYYETEFQIKDGNKVSNMNKTNLALIAQMFQVSEFEAAKMVILKADETIGENDIVDECLSDGSDNYV